MTEPEEARGAHQWLYGHWPRVHDLFEAVEKRLDRHRAEIDHIKAAHSYKQGKLL
jgi:hypothetical protein